MGSLGESVKKEKLLMKILFQVMLTEVLKSCQKKKIFPDAKADVKQQKIKELIAVSYNF